MKYNMNFRTQIPISKSSNPMDYSSRVVSLGSCFAVNISQKLEYFKFQNYCNPYGILFHPLAIEKAIDFALRQKEFTAEDLFFHNEQWHSYDVHSDLSYANPEVVLQSLNEITKVMHSQLVYATHVIITLGTAWVYQNVESNHIVANCHKVPQKQFKKELLTVEQVRKSLKNIIFKLQEVNPTLQIIFTVSPVRHIKDGFVENQQSKAHLIAAIHETMKEGVTYFPSYEIMMDELRDYRFYTEDMIHPSAVAIDYIWERFSNSWIEDEANKTMTKVDDIQKGLRHRPFNPDSAGHQKFKLGLTKKINDLKVQYPLMKF